MQPQEIPTQRVGGSGRGAGVLAVVVAIGLLVAALKPWEARPASVAAPPQPPGSAPAAASRAPQTTPGGRAASPTSTLDPEIAAALTRRQCYAEAWRLVTVERSPTRRTRTLFPAEPLPAAGPADPAIVGHRLWASELLGMGVCVPASDRDGVEEAFGRLTIWRVHGSRPPEKLGSLTPLDEQLYRLGEAYFRPPAGMPGAATWPPGRYVFQIDPLGEATQSGWFALDFLGDGRTAAEGVPARP